MPITRTPITRTRATRTRAVAALLAVGVPIAAGCAPEVGAPAPPPVERFRVAATTFHNVNQNEFVGNFNEFDEPYLLQVGFSVKLGVPNSATAFTVEDYPNEICRSGDGIPQPGLGHKDHSGPTVCAIPAAQGRVDLPAVQRLDVVDVLAKTAPLQIQGVLSIAMEADGIFNGGPGVQLNAIRDEIRSMLNSTVAAGTVPATKEALRDLVKNVVGNALQFIGGRALDFLLGFGNADDRIGFGATFLVGARGTLADLLRPVLGNISLDTTLGNDSLKARTGVLEPQTYSIAYHGDASRIGNVFGGDTDYRYDYAVTNI